MFSYRSIYQLYGSVLVSFYACMYYLIPISWTKRDFYAYVIWGYFPKFHFLIVTVKNRIKLYASKK